MSIQTIVLITLIPAAAMIVGAAVAGAWSPSGSVQNGIQHFTAGVVLAAVAVELVPELHITEQPVAMAGGFIAGVVIMLLIRTLLEEKDGEADESDVLAPQQSRSRAMASAAPLLAAIGVDVFVDGLLSGVTLATTQEGGRVVVGALSLEVLFLGLATASVLRQRGLSVTGCIAFVGGLSVLIPVGGLAGPLTLQLLPASLQTSVLAFATAALLYLVFEELFAEAHEQGADTNLTTAMLFVGFLAVLLIKAYLG